MGSRVPDVVRRDCVNFGTNLGRINLNAIAKTLLGISCNRQYRVLHPAPSFVN